MATFTKNLNLEKPAQDDFYDIDVQNSNMEKIDEALGENINTHNLKSYTDLAQVGLNDAVASIEAIFAAMPDNSELIVDIAHNSSLYPTELGTARFVKIQNSRAFVEVYEHYGDTAKGKKSKYYGLYNYTNGFSGWIADYNTFKKPTPAEIGAMPTSGGEFTDDVTFNTAKSLFFDAVDGTQFRISTDYNGYFSLQTIIDGILKSNILAVDKNGEIIGSESKIMPKTGGEFSKPVTMANSQGIHFKSANGNQFRIVTDSNKGFVQVLKPDGSFVADILAFDLETGEIIGGKLMPKSDLLWQNASPTSTFAAQTVSLDLSNYKKVGVLMLAHETGELITSNYVETLINFGSQCRYTQDSTTYRRNFSVSQSGIKFGSAYNNTSQADWKMIPYQIWGYK